MQVSQDGERLGSRPPKCREPRCWEGPLRRHMTLQARVCWTERKPQGSQTKMKAVLACKLGQERGQGATRIGAACSLWTGYSYLGIDLVGRCHTDAAAPRIWVWEADRGLRTGSCLLGKPRSSGGGHTVGCALLTATFPVQQLSDSSSYKLHYEIHFTPWPRTHIHNAGMTALTTCDTCSHFLSCFFCF